jgi:hypothetical protein
VVGGCRGSPTHGRRPAQHHPRSAGRRPPTNCINPATRRRTGSNPRASSAPVSSSGSNIRTPARAPRKPSQVRLRQVVSSAIRPPGASTRASSSSAAHGAARSCNTPKQQTAPNAPDRNGRRAMSARRKATLPSGAAAAGVALTARMSGSGAPSTPTMTPRAPTMRAKSRVSAPSPQPASSTASPGPSPSSSRAIRRSSPVPGPSDPCAIWCSSGRRRGLAGTTSPAVSRARSR